MTRAQREALIGIVRDDSVTIMSMEYPAHPDHGPYRAALCLKVIYTVEIQGIYRTFVDWYEPADAVIASTRELVERYGEPMPDWLKDRLQT